MNHEKHPIDSRRRLLSFKYAFHGIIYAIRTQQNLRIHLISATMVIIAGFIFDLHRIEWLILILCIGFVICAELFNTAIESLADEVEPDYNPRIKIVKDLAAAAVFVSAIVSAIIGLIIFIPKFGLWE